MALPQGSWDSHVHVIDKERYQMRDDSPFNPKQATVESLLEFEAQSGIGHVCIVASSIFGTDNSCLVDALRRLKGKGRGIAYIDTTIVTKDELRELHDAGVRGVRLNLWTRGLNFGTDPEKWRAVLEPYARLLRPLDWVLQIYLSMDQIPNIAPLIPELGIRVVFDHLGCPNPGRIPAQQPGCEELYELLRNHKNVFVKISGAYRFEAEVPDLDQHIIQLLRNSPDQVVWASDWPHTGGMKNNPGGNPKNEQEFLTPDVPGFLQRCLQWCDNDSIRINKLFVQNPRRLWDYTGDD